MLPLRRSPQNPACPPKNSLEHRRAQAARLRVLATWMVRTDQSGAGTDIHFCTVSEFRSRGGRRPRYRVVRIPVGPPRDCPQSNYDSEILQQIELFQ